MYLSSDISHVFISGSSVRIDIDKWKYNTVRDIKVVCQLHLVCLGYIQTDEP